ncbi:MAG: hypothetical protein R2690_06075 [Acidimicrobiales bacterium]
MSTEAVNDTATESAADDAPAQLVPISEPIIAISDDALGKIVGVREAEEEPDGLVLRVAVTGVNGVEYAYDLSFEPRDELTGELRIYEVGELTVVVPVDSVDSLNGAVLDIPSNPAQGGLVIRNPNRPNPLDGRNLELTGDLAEQVTQLLEQSVNPSLASTEASPPSWGRGHDGVRHHGRRLSGLLDERRHPAEGIQVAIKEAIPEVTDVVDVTDHTAGENYSGPRRCAGR